MWKNGHPVHGSGIRTIRTHNLQIESLIPQPLDQGSRRIFIYLGIIMPSYFTQLLLPQEWFSRVERKSAYTTTPFDSQ